jgi:hypothetical protein
MSALSSPFFGFLQIFCHLFFLFWQTTPFTHASGLVRFVDRCVDDHGSLIIFRSASARPKHLFDPYFDHD